MPSHRAGLCAFFNRAAATKEWRFLTHVFGLDTLVTETTHGGDGRRTVNNLEGPLYRAGAPVVQSPALIMRPEEAGERLFLSGRVVEVGTGRPMPHAKSPAEVLQAIAEVREGRRFYLSLPLDLPGGNLLAERRHPPVLRPTIRNGQANVNYQLGQDNPALTDVMSDDAVLLHTQYSTQWDGLAHVGQMFDADGDGVLEPRDYNGYLAGPVQAWHPPRRAMAPDAFGRLVACARPVPLPADGAAAAPAWRKRLPGYTGGDRLTMPARIATLSTTRLNIRLRQPIAMSFGTVRVQNVILGRMRDADDVAGLGEASILGGPYWGEESAESVQAINEIRLAPVLVGTEITGVDAVAACVAGLVRGNAAARGAVEMAAIDLLGKRLGVRAVHLLGGPSRHGIPVAWTLSTGSTSGDVEEGERALAERGHRRFKLKLGRATAAADVARAAAVVEAFRGRASVIADGNGVCDGVMAARFLPALAQAGLEAIEQPLPAGDVDGIARLRTGLGMEVIADEAVTSLQAAFRVAAGGGASVLSLKPNREGGLTASRRVAAVAAASGVGLYGGTMLETSLGTAASLALFATLPDLRLGGEQFGPLRLADDIVAAPLTPRDGTLLIPAGPGFGVTLDEDCVAFLARQREPGARHLGAVA